MLKLLSYLEGRVVRKHDPAAADTYRRGIGRDLADENFRRVARERRGVVVLGYPIAPVPVPLRLDCQRDGLAQGLRRRAPLPHRGLIDDAERDVLGRNCLSHPNKSARYFLRSRSFAQTSSGVIPSAARSTRVL